MLRLVVFFLLFSCPCQAQIKFGTTLKQLNLTHDSSYIYLLVAPNQIEKARIVYKDSICFNVVSAVYGKANYIFTNDKKFKTPEGISVGDSYLIVKPNKSDSLVHDYRGWGKFIKIKSGWDAVFDDKSPLCDTSRVLFFFKR